MNHNNQGANAVYNDIHFFNLYDLPIALDGESYHEYLQRVAPVDGLRAEGALYGARYAVYHE